MSTFINDTELGIDMYQETANWSITHQTFVWQDNEVVGPHIQGPERAWILQEGEDNFIARVVDKDGAILGTICLIATKDDAQDMCWEIMRLIGRTNDHRR